MSDPFDLLDQRLGERGNQPVRRGDTIKAQCPAHDDRTPSLSVTRYSDGKVGVKCFAGCSTDDVLAALGLKKSDLRPARQPFDEIIERYVYTDAEGTALYRVCRTRNKQFFQQRANGDGTWKKGVTGLPKLLYRLPEVIAAVAAGRTIYVCEGEKDVDRMRVEGVVATCNSEGAEKFLPSQADVLRSADVVIVADRDDAGTRHAVKVRELLLARDARVKVVHAAVGKDAYDHLAAGKGIDEFVDFDLSDIESAPEPTGLLEWTDSAVAVAFANEVRGRFGYVGEWHQWVRWDDRRWAVDTCQSVYEAARRWIVDQRKALVENRAGADAEKAARRYADKFRIDAVVTLAARMDGIAFDVARFDRRPELLNVRNGIVDLRTGELRPHDPTEYLTQLADTDYLPGASHTDLAAMLDALNAETRQYAQRIFGYAATGEVVDDIVLVLDGTGANGKSTVLVAVQAALGDYAGPADARLLMATKHEDHPAIKAALRGRRLVAISETEENGHLNAARLKSLAGGEPITARVMRGDWFTFTPTHKIVVATNHRPDVTAGDDAVWRRLRLLPFPYTYVDADVARPGDRVKDRRLRTRLQNGKAQREAVLAWLVAGSVDWYRDGLGRSTQVDDATAQWRRSLDPLGRFIEERLVFDEQLRLKGSELYSTYTEWCFLEGHRPMSNTRFAIEFMAHELVKGRVVKTTPHGSSYYANVGRSSASDGEFSVTTTTEVGGGGYLPIEPMDSLREEFNGEPPTTPHLVSVTSAVADWEELF